MDKYRGTNILRLCRLHLYVRLIDSFPWNTTQPAVHSPSAAPITFEKYVETLAVALLRKDLTSHLHVTFSNP